MIIHTTNNPPFWINCATFPKIIPATEKSASENVQFAKLRLPITGIQIAGKNVISKPCKKEPNTQPFKPPSAFANTPALAPQKKCGITPGNIKATGKKEASIKPKINNPKIPPRNDTKNPIKTAFGA